MAYTAGWHVVGYDRLNISRSVFRHFTHARDYLLKKVAERADYADSIGDSASAQGAREAMKEISQFGEGECSKQIGCTVFYIEAL